MRKFLFATMIAIIFVVMSCDSKPKENKDKQMTDNILLKGFDTPYGVPPFDKIKPTDFIPAFDSAIAEMKSEIDAIVKNSEAPNFENTIEAIERAGFTLDRVSSVFFNLTESNNSEEMEEIATIVSPKVTALSDEIYMNDALFQKVKIVYENSDTTGWTSEKKMLLQKTYKHFVRGGANLNAEQKKRLSEINRDLGLLSLKFESNVLKENNNFKMIIDKQEDLAGLPTSAIEAAAEEAKAAGMTGKWLFTIQKTSLIPFLTYSEKRDLREKMFKAYTMKGNNNDSLDNKDNVVKIVNLRLEKANLLGYKTYAHYVLEETMAKTPERANELVTNVLKRAAKRAKQEVIELQKLADSEKAGIKIEPWDWWFYAEKLRKQKYDLSEEELRPYFKLENVRDGMFDVATKLFGISFRKTTELPLMDPEAEAYEVLNKNGEVIAILYNDYFPRASKRSGAWMTNFREQQKDAQGKNIIPIISLTTNFTKPTASKPSLLNLDEVETLFHEFGHCLHGIMSNCTYQSIAGTNVPRDFVELPSQIMENWATEPEVMKAYAKHYQTGEPIPDALIEKIKKSSSFNQGFVASEFVAAAALDMYWHSISQPFTGDVNAFESKVLAEAGLIPQIVVRYRSTYYSHIYGGGYAAGYYAYLWTAVLDADAFGAFQETTLFDAATATSFLNNILSQGGTRDADEMWKAFRGREPKIDFYLKRQGLE
jgi:peptidyl-dipeptidase Dcp